MDLHNSDGTIDAHVRIETYKEIGTHIYIDLFDSTVENASEAHITSESFHYGLSGAKSATEFLRDNGFNIVVAVK
jgi:hypothetical protein